jgi:hypothetical protein
MWTMNVTEYAIRDGNSIPTELKRENVWRDNEDLEVLVSDFCTERAPEPTYRVYLWDDEPNTDFRKVFLVTNFQGHQFRLDCVRLS